MEFGGCGVALRRRFAIIHRGQQIALVHTLADVLRSKSAKPRLPQGKHIYLVFDHNRAGSDESFLFDGLGRGWQAAGMGAAAATGAACVELLHPVKASPKTAAADITKTIKRHLIRAPLTIPATTRVWTRSTSPACGKKLRPPVAIRFNLGPALHSVAQRAIGIGHAHTRIKEPFVALHLASRADDIDFAVKSAGGKAVEFHRRTLSGTEQGNVLFFNGDIDVGVRGIDDLRKGIARSQAAAGQYLRYEG